MLWNILRSCNSKESTVTFIKIERGMNVDYGQLQHDRDFVTIVNNVPWR